MSTGKKVGIGVAVLIGLGLIGWGVSHVIGSKDDAATQQPTPTQTAAQTQAPAATHTEARLQGRTMGTVYHISYFGDEIKDLTPEQVQAQLDALLVDFNNEFSTWQKDSVISRFNDIQVAEQRFEISERFYNLIKKAQFIHSQTEGYDITVDPLVRAWGFGPDKPQANLTPDQVNKLKEHVGMEKFDAIADGGKYYLIKHDPQVRIDLSSIAKGLGTDEVARKLKSLGAQNFIAEIGGEIVTSGSKAGGQPWRVAIEEPNFDGSTSVQTILDLSNAALATSGNYRNYRVEDGRRLTHVIDPKTGYPIVHNTASLTVVANDCETADGYSTGLFVAGADRALEIANRLGLAIYVIEFKDGKFVTRMSEAFSKIHIEKQ